MWSIPRPLTGMIEADGAREGLGQQREVHLLHAKCAKRMWRVSKQKVI
jgi:hypothetical protein